VVKNRFVTAPDDSTVVLRFQAPLAAFPDVLTDLAILPAHALDSVPHTRLRQTAWNEHPVGNGPFRFVAHEANLSIDEAEGRRGLVYIRKQPATLREIVEAAQQTAKLLGEPFDSGKFEIFVNDRLATPSAAQIAEALGGKATPKKMDPRERLTFVVERS